ncbi:MAG: hypothetical protein JNJ40_06095 [Bacteroidia bacterium]|nr:hypothetical protein [Bacteroidia bacterium]
MYRLIILFSFVFIYQNVFCQVRIIKHVKHYPPQTNLSIGGGLNRSVLILTRNVKNDNDALGFNFSLTYGGAKLLRGKIEYTHYNRIDIEPTWYNIKSSTLEINLQALARFKKTRAYFYPLFGLSYNLFSGYFTGKNDFLNIGEKYKKNTIARTNWFGINTGVGYEYSFKKISIVGEYKMRVGNSGPQLNIMDVCFSFGLTYHLKVPSIYKIFSGTKNRYFLN